MTAAAASAVTSRQAVLEDLAARSIQLLETNELPEQLFADDVFVDFTMPLWRLQAQGPDDLLALRRQGHPCRGTVPRHRLDLTERGFVLEVEERWTDDVGERWYCRELFRADVSEAGLITQLTVYCTGDWDSAQVAQHAREVTLIAP